MYSARTWNWTSDWIFPVGTLVFIVHGLLAASTHALVFHWHYAFSYILLPLWLVLKSQMMFSLDGKHVNSVSDRLCSKASCLCTWLERRKSLENSWVKIREILLVFSDSVFSLHCYYWQDDTGVHKTPAKWTLISTLPPRQWHYDQLNHWGCQGICSFGNSCYVYVMNTMFSMLQLSSNSVLLKILGCMHAGI